ncbi:type VII toxin-antitoxin system HepT family RNase toxin [Sporohalobacter salinus]|uniref:type VII toxin-antitoxin system HepT family RNase toxin n=1 Tax=Sporohalobacter salinus TaxID=1494606 RepID=UPI00196131F9|nr:uncharacterized protein YutE (UPF0331/DUF86 family) [Sporohalobacter salinus]
MINESRIQEKIYYIKQNLGKLRELRNLSREEFLNDYRNYDTAKYNLQSAIEAVIDISNHIISRNNYRVPNSNADTFRVLNEEGILPNDKLTSYISMAKFRNKVVHLYEKIDEEEIYKILKGNLVDFEEFIEIIVQGFLS